MNANEQVNASGADSSAASPSVTTTNAGQPDAALEAKLRETEARATKAEQEQARLRGELDALQPFVRYETDQSAAAPASPEEDEDPVVKLQKENQKLAQQLASQGKEVQAIRGDLIARTFLLENPDLKPWEATLIAEFQQTPGRTADDRLQKAAEKTRQRIKDHRDQVLKEADDARKAKDRSTARLEGVMDGSVTPPVEPKPEEKADLETYSGMRRKEQSKTRGGAT